MRTVLRTRFDLRVIEHLFLGIDAVMHSLEEAYSYYYGRTNVKGVRHIFATGLRQLTFENEIFSFFIDSIGCICK